MAAHVYEFDKSELDELKKLLSYDPYLDPNVIPPSPSVDKSKESPEERKMREERERGVQERLRSLRENDRHFEVIFSRQEYEIFDGAALGLDAEKSYLYLKANEEFLGKADAALEQKVKNLKRAGKEAEERVLKKVLEDEESANAGLGSIFG